MDKSQNASEPLYEVVWPLGPTVQPESVAPVSAIADLNGKTIGEMWDHRFKGDLMYEVLNEELRKRYPGIKIVDYKTMGNTHDTKAREYIANLPDKLKQHGCDAVVSSIGA